MLSSSIVSSSDLQNQIIRKNDILSIINGISFVVRSFVGVRPFFFLYCTTVQFCCTCAVDIRKEKADHGHKKGHAPRALHGALIHGHLKAANKDRGARSSVPNYLRLSRASRGHLNLFTGNLLETEQNSRNPEPRQPASTP